VAKKKSSASLTRFERTAGTVFFLIYLFVLPLISGKGFALLERLLDTDISDSVQNVIYYYALFAATLLIFYRYILNTTRRFLNALERTASTVCIGLLVFYGANELLYRVFRALFHSAANLNDMAITAQVNAAPRTTALIVIVLSPFVEEVLFRGLVFGGLKEKSRVIAYTVSCLLFAFLHVWTFALSSGDMSYFVLMLQYLVPGLVFAWAYDHAGNLWASMLLHAAVNALSMWAILS